MSTGGVADSIGLISEWKRGIDIRRETPKTGEVNMITAPSGG